MARLNVVAWFAVIIVNANAVRIFVRDQGRSKVECTTLKDAITDSITAAGITFFADHPRGNDTFDPNSIEPFTPSVLIKKYYGHEASAVQFTEAILTIAYAAENIPEKRMDRDEMRRNLYSYIKAGSYEYSRQKAGELLRNIAEEYVGDSAEWKLWDCVAGDKIFDVMEAMEVEYYRILNEVGDVKFGQFLSLGIGSTLAFCIDDTGSMSGEIEAAKKRAQVIVEHSRGTLDAPQDFVLVPFNDPSVGPVTVTSEAALYHQALGKLYAHGGGDSPELAMRGIQLAIENSRPGSIIYVITDATAKDVHLQDAVLAQARQKSITVTFLLTVNLHTCPPSGEYLRCMGLYKHIARETGGKTLVIGRGDIFRATDIVQQSAKQGIVPLKTVVFDGNKKKPHHLLHFHVDSNLQGFQIEAQGRCENMYASLPNKLGHVNLKESRFGDVWTGEIELSTLNKSWVGEWKMGVDVDSSSCKVKIRAQTTMGYVFTLFSRQNNMPDDTFQILQGNPSVDSIVAVTLDGYGMDEFRVNEGKSVTLKCINQRGKVLHEVVVNSLKGNELKHVFDSNVTKLEPFYIMVEGTDQLGNRYQRMHSALINPSHVRIDCDLSNLTIVAGSSVTSNITITNNGNEDQFVVTTSDERRISSFHNGATAKWNIPSEGVISKSLKLNVPDKLRDGTAVPITIVVRGKSKGSFQHGKCTLVVGQKKRPRIDSFAVKTVINARFAETVVTSTVTNNAAVGREAEFDMLLPKAAFITAIRIELGNETIHGVIEEKKKAAKIYERAKEIGTVAGHVAARDSSTRSYRTSMFVEAGQKVRFVLTYQEFLLRARGRYEYGVILKPDQPIRSLTVDIHISEEKPLSFVRVAPLKTTSVNLVDKVPVGSSVTLSRHNYAAHVHYHPDLTDQLKMSPKGIAGTFRIEYDVQRTDMYGDIAFNNGYFAHFFAPPNLPPMPKIVVLVVDTSGSMYGYKIKQVKDALSAIIKGLNPNDKFNVIFFGDEASSPTNRTILEASKENIAKTVEDIKAVKAFGGTNMEGAFDLLFETFAPYLPELERPEIGESSGEEQSGAEPPDVETEDSEVEVEKTLTKRDAGLEFEYVKMAVFMTDGRPSIGETDTKALRRDVKNMNQERISIHTIGLGSLVDFGFLEKLAHENDGTSRRIFEGIDADAQIHNFFEEIANPVLKDVTFEYPEHKTKDLTETTFSVFLGGSELVVAGKVTPFKESTPSLAEELEDDEFDIMPVSPIFGGSPAKFLISGRVRGSKFNDETETMDFDLDPTKTSKIDESNLKIQNYTEKLWAFMTLKKLLLDASIEKNKTVKEELNSRALNMSLKHGLVTPLTSLIVIRAKEKEAIESQLREESALKPTVLTTTTARTYVPILPMAEDETLDYMTSTSFGARGMELASEAFVDTPVFGRTATRFRTVSRPRRPPPSSRRIVGGGGGFSGDPHFVIPVMPGVKFCFNFDGTTGQIYNFLTDPRREIVVNGMLINSPAPPGGRRLQRTYVSTLGIVAKKYRKKILITPWDTTIVEPGSENITIPASAKLTIEKGGFRIQFTPPTRGSSTVQVVIDGLIFKVTQHGRVHSPYSRDHLDFSLSNDMRSLSRESDGVFGQFTDFRNFTSSKDGGLEHPVLISELTETVDGELRGKLRVRGKIIPVVERKMPMPSSHEVTSCWYLHKNGVEAMRRPKDLFQISDIFDTPKF